MISFSFPEAGSRYRFVDKKFHAARVMASLFISSG